MSWLAPLGFLGLLGIVVLILIYIIKPNYQQKIISSTYIWKLSLRYKKKTVPISRLRNLLLFLCQVLIISACAFLLAEPVIVAGKEVYSNEVVAIVDASGSMRASEGGQTRFERAVAEVKKKAKSVSEANGNFHVILAGEEASFVVSSTDTLKEAYEALDELIAPSSVQTLQGCLFSEGDVSGAIRLAETVLQSNPETEIILYTGTTYVNHGDVKIMDVSQPGEWNAAVLDASVDLEDGYYVFDANIQVYGGDQFIGEKEFVEVYCDVYGYNGDDSGEPYTFVQKNVSRTEVNLQRVRFDSAVEWADVYGLQGGIFSYEYVHIYVQEADSLAEDDDFYLYGGTKPTIRIQYASQKPNTFIRGIVSMLKQNRGKYWDIDFKEVVQGGEYETEGYDFYIFEHFAPDKLPSDGMCLFINPPVGTNIADFKVTDEVTGEKEFMPAESHEITDGLLTEKITVDRYVRIHESGDYSMLTFCDNDPVFMVRNEDTVKVAVLAFSLNDSQLPVLSVFPKMMLNLFDYFISPTITNYVFEVGDEVVFNPRGSELTVKGAGLSEELILEASDEGFPYTMTVNVYGHYELTHWLPLKESDETVMFYVTIPDSQSNIFTVVDVLETPVTKNESMKIDEDLLVYFAAALVFLLFAEWLLQAKGL